MKDLPDKYWHCMVSVIGQKSHAVVNDLSIQELQRQIVDPWLRNLSFPVAGLVVAGRDKVEKIRISQTGEPKEHFAQQWDAESRARGVTDWATDRRLVPIWRGRDYTHELLFANLDQDAPEPEIGLILQICERLPAAARILAHRRTGKAAYEINDEYDVQDLLHALLRAYLKYSVQEEPLGKIAAVRSGRADIAIEDLGAIVEVKYVRGPEDQRRIVDEYSNDLLLYTKWAPLKHLVFMVYNSQDLRDPEALDKLGGLQSINGIAFKVYIVLA